MAQVYRHAGRLGAAAWGLGYSEKDEGKGDMY